MPQNRFASADEMCQALLNIRDQALVALSYDKALEALDGDTAISAVKKQGRTANVRTSDIRHENRVKNLSSYLSGIVTTQKELDAFNVLKRLLERNGWDGELLDMEDTPDFCNIHLKSYPNLVVVRLYFNDESNLSFAIPNVNGSEDVCPISTLRGIAPKSESILSRLEWVQRQAGLSFQQRDDEDYIPQDDDDLIEREIQPLVTKAISNVFGSDFRLISIQIEDDPFRAYGQFEDLENQVGEIFDYELSLDDKERMIIFYEVSPECLGDREEEDAARREDEDQLATQGIYTVGWLQRNFDSFKAAKDHFGIRAKSWTKLVERLNQG